MENIKIINDSNNLNEFRFTVDDIEFFLNWKKDSRCLLIFKDFTGRIEICYDLHVAYYMVEPNGYLTEEIAKAAAKHIAPKIIADLRNEELKQMENIYNSQGKFQNNKTYKTFKHKNIPAVWDIHLGSIYIKEKNWEYIGWAKTEEEVLKIIEPKIKISPENKGFLQNFLSFFTPNKKNKQDKS